MNTFVYLPLCLQEGPYILLEQSRTVIAVNRRKKGGRKEGQVGRVFPCPKARERADAKVNGKKARESRPLSGNLIPAGTKETDPKDIAQLAADFILENTQPDDVLEQLFRVLKDSDKLDNRAKRACNHALHILIHGSNPVPSTNGQPVAAVA